MKTNYDDEVALANELGVIDTEEDQDIYKALSETRLLGENAIPIAPNTGERFRIKFEEGLLALKEKHEEWLKNIELYTNKAGIVNNVAVENLVRITIETLVDFSYMKNPSAEFSAYDAKDKDFADLVQKIVMALINKKYSPGINLQPKIIKQMIFAHLTNFGVLELTYQGNFGSYEEVFDLNEKVKSKISTEEDPERLEALYGHLSVLQDELENRNHMGIGVRYRSPFSLIVDAKTENLDLSDADVVMVRDALDINHIRAEYGYFDEEENCYYYRYDANKKLPLEAGEVKETRTDTEKRILSQILSAVDSEQAQLRIKNTVNVVWVYDKITKQKYLYLEDSWETPLWVYADEMELSRFFPFFILAFSTPIASVVQSGEVAHYAAFQEEINTIGAQLSKVRRTGFNRLLYNSAMFDKQEVEKLMSFLNDPSIKTKALGVKIKDVNIPLSEILEPVKLPTTQFKELFDTSTLREALAKTTRVSEAAKGAEYKTNTTNQAIASYNETTNNRLEGLTAKIEAVVEDLLWAIAEISVSKMTELQVQELLSEEDAKAFTSISVKDFNIRHQIVLAAGSTEKPTSLSKKQEAIQVIQMLGQFGTAAPRTVMSLVTRLLRSAFSKTLVTDKDIALMEQEGQAGLQQQQQQQQTPKGA